MVLVFHVHLCFLRSDQVVGRVSHSDLYKIPLMSHTAVDTFNNDGNLLTQHQNLKVTSVLFYKLVSFSSFYLFKDKYDNLPLTNKKLNT